MIVPLLKTAAQPLKGDVADYITNNALTNVTIQNINTQEKVITGADGTFQINATADQLLQFQKEGYQTVRVRIPKQKSFPYFKITLEPDAMPVQPAIPLDDYEAYKADSIRFRRLYAHELDFARLSAAGVMAHPFSAMDKQNKEIWHFQDDYNEFEKDKYIDKMFNPKIVSSITGLKGDSLQTYMYRFRPDYTTLRQMNNYNYYMFIKKSSRIYRGLDKERSSH